MNLSFGTRPIFGLNDSTGLIISGAALYVALYVGIFMILHVVVGGSIGPS